jgi:hypothetical protein
LRDDKVEGARVVHDLDLVGSDGGLNDGEVGLLGVILVVVHDARINALSVSLRRRINDVERLHNFGKIEVRLRLICSTPVWLIGNVAASAGVADITADVQNVDAAELSERTLLERGEAALRSDGVLQHTVTVKLGFDFVPALLREAGSANGDVVDDPRSDVTVSAKFVDVGVNVIGDNVLIPPSVGDAESFGLGVSPAVAAGPASDVDLLRRRDSGVVQLNMAHCRCCVMSPVALPVHEIPKAFELGKLFVELQQAFNEILRHLIVAGDKRHAGVRARVGEADAARGVYEEQITKF